MNEFFKSAVPVWVKDAEELMNCRVRFKALAGITNSKKTTIRIATSGVYQLTVNGSFVAYGPARAGKGHFRVDEWDISDWLTKPCNTVVVEVCGYNANSFYLQEQSSFVIAEISEEEKVVAWTGEHFSAQINPHYIQRTQRYSYQRPFLEAYRVKNDDSFLTDSEKGNEVLCRVRGGELLKRYAPYPLFERIFAEATDLNGEVEFCKPQAYVRDRAITEVGTTIRGFEFSELDICVSDMCQEMIFKPVNDKSGACIPENSYRIYSFPYNATSMVTMSVECEKDIKLFVLFDEILRDQIVDFSRLDCVNAVYYELPAGKHNLQFFEVYTMKYVQVISVDGACNIESVGMIEYKHPPIQSRVNTSDETIKKIVDAAIETYRQNSVDLFTDCPSRERAGWLCDSFFTSRTEFCLMGKSIVEKSFLENFLHEENYEGLPEGMVPMCYPSDCYNGLHIPNWAMWLILELKEYLQRTDDRELINRFKTKVLGILKYFERFENSDELLESLDGWVFVEWSKANDLVQDVNYPTNMLYYATLKTAAELYEMPQLYNKAERIKDAVLKQSFDGKFFCDNAVRKEGKLILTGECTEVCQYYAFFFDIAKKETHEELLDIIINFFGPNRDTCGEFAHIYPANAFIGNYLRMDILMKFGCYEMVLENMKSFFGYMAERTGTLWEHTDTQASCNHGFASYAYCLLYELQNKGFLKGMKKS